MGLISSGPVCDVCGNYILDPEDRINFFRVKGIKHELICDNKCKGLAVKAGNDWTKLPDGPLRKAFVEALKGE